MNNIKKYLVIGNPISHSLSPDLHNYWLKKNNIDGIYNKKKMNLSDLENFFINLKDKKIIGANVTVPFKKDVISYVDELSVEAEHTQSVNTIYLKNDKIVGHNTDIRGFELALKDTGYDVVGKRILILGAGGVVPSIIFALNKMKASKILISNRTRTKAENLNNHFKYLAIVDWGELPEFDMIINATSVGLKSNEKLDLDFLKIGNNKFFYDVIYNPKETNFLKTGKKLGNKTENGEKMFIYQAAEAFKIWHGIQPVINNEVKELLEK
tara:strand:+ start:1343 stop:2146 length:804 start_codon:yes stop_codon:yes gene_type:complete